MKNVEQSLPASPSRHRQGFIEVSDPAPSGRTMPYTVPWTAPYHGVVATYRYLNGRGSILSHAHAAEPGLKARSLAPHHRSHLGAILQGATSVKKDGLYPGVRSTGSSW